MAKTIELRDDNDGVTVKVNFWPMKPYMDVLESSDARMWMTGQVTWFEDGETKNKKFHHAGELLTLLSELNHAFDLMKQGEVKRSVIVYE